MRLACDYRYVNSFTVADVFPLCTVDEMISLSQKLPPPKKNSRVTLCRGSRNHACAGTETPEPIWIKFCKLVDITNVVIRTNFGDYRLRGFSGVGDQIFPSPIDFHRRPYNTLALPSQRVTIASTGAGGQGWPYEQRHVQQRQLYLRRRRCR